MKRLPSDAGKEVWLGELLKIQGKQTQESRKNLFSTTRNLLRRRRVNYMHSFFIRMDYES
jgi:hypothetical protein